MLLHRHFERDSEDKSNMTTSNDVSPMKKQTEEGMDMPLHTTPNIENSNIPIDMIGQKRGRPRRV